MSFKFVVGKLLGKWSYKLWKFSSKYNHKFDWMNFNGKKPFKIKHNSVFRTFQKMGF